jgi:hypothetical protein
LTIDGTVGKRELLGGLEYRFGMIQGDPQSTRDGGAAIAGSLLRRHGFNGSHGGVNPRIPAATSQPKLYSSDKNELMAFDGYSANWVIKKH